MDLLAFVLYERFNNYKDSLFYYLSVLHILKTKLFYSLKVSLLEIFIDYLPTLKLFVTSVGQVNSRGKIMNIGIGRPLITSPSAICIFCISVAKTIQSYTIHYALVLFILISLQSEKGLVLYYFEVRYECLLKKNHNYVCNFTRF